MEQQGKSLRDYVDILRRRRWQFAFVATSLFVLAAAVAWWLPPVYRSTATILIEQQEIPSDLLGRTISSFADQRVQVISQQQLSRASLMRIIEKYGLYGADKTGKASASKIERLRKNIQLELVKAEVTDQRSGSRTTATIAFTLSYDGETPLLAQSVATELAALFVTANMKERQEQAAETSSFFAGEAAKLSERITQTEAQLADFKARNMGSLPEQLQLNLQQRERIELDIKDADRQISALEERKFYLEGQLAQVKPTGPLVTSTGERVLDEAERLKQLQARYASLAGVYSVDHPDMIKMRTEIEALRKVTGAAAEAEEQFKRLAELRAELSAARDKYSDDHPDILRLKNLIAALEGSVANPASPPPAPRDTRADNPAFITLRSQLEAVNSELRNLRNKRAELKAAIVTLESRLARAPQVERQYFDLVRAHEHALKRYEEVRGKQVQAQVAQQLEKESKGERFLVLDPPQLPEAAHSPNRLAILLLGFLLSVGGGAAYAGIRESLDDAVHGARALAESSGVPMLAVIPYIDAGSESGAPRGLTGFVTASRAVLAVGIALGVCWSTMNGQISSHGDLPLPVASRAL